VKERIPYIDSLRGLAVIFMVQQHLLSWLWNKTWYSYSLSFNEHPIALSLNFFGNFAAPLFLLIAGTGACSMWEHPGVTTVSYLKRGLFILLCGYFLNLATPHWFSIGSWYILHTIGISLVIAPLLFLVGTRLLLLIMSVLLILPAFIQTWLSIPLITGNNFMNNTTGNGSISRLAFAEGHFPIIPWLAFFIAGILCHRWLINNEKKKIIFTAIISIFSGLSLAFFYIHGFFFATGARFFRLFVFTPSIYPPHPAFILILLGIALILFYTYSNFKYFNNSLFSILIVPIGKSSLSWFFIHIIIFNELTRILGFHRIFNSTGSLFIILLFISAMMVLSYIWEKRQFKFSIEWLMRKCV